MSLLSLSLPPEDKWCPLTEMSPMAFFHPQSSVPPLRFLHTFRTKNVQVWLFSCTETAEFFSSLWRTRDSHRQNNRRSVLMLHRAMGGERKRKKMLKGRRGHDWFWNINSSDEEKFHAELSLRQFLWHPSSSKDPVIHIYSTKKRRLIQKKKRSCT